MSSITDTRNNGIHESNDPGSIDGVDSKAKVAYAPSNKVAPSVPSKLQAWDANDSESHSRDVPETEKFG